METTVDTTYQNILSHLEQSANQEYFKWKSNPEKTSENIRFGYNTKCLRDLWRDCRKWIKPLLLEEKFDLALQMVNSNISGLRYASVWVVQEGLNELKPDDFDFLETFIDQFRGWGITDEFCLRVIQPLLLSFPEEVLTLLEKWTDSPNQWKRRLSVITFVRKIGKTGQYTQICIDLCEKLIWDEEDLVRKGVGWALKDIMRGDKTAVKQYVKDLRKRGVSAVITLYAIRDLNGEEREEILAVTKEI
jgi:3-methyladenine DNA glycosylase AlkD